MKNLFLFLILTLFFSAVSLNAVSTQEKELPALVERLNSLRAEGLRALDSHNYRKAEELFKEALFLNPKRWISDSEFNELILSLVHAQVHNKHYNQASKHFSDLIQSAMTEKLSYYRDVLGAEILYGQGRAQSSMKALNNLRRRSPLKDWKLSDQKFYLKVKNGLDRYFEDLFTQAERCYEGGIYAETIPLYYEILEAIEDGIYALEAHSKLPYQLRSRIAYSEFRNGHYLQAKEMLEEAKSKFPVLFEPESFQRLVVSCRELEEYEKALAYCNEFFTFKYSPTKNDAIKYEMACIYFQKNEKLRAKKLFSDLLQDLKDKKYLVLTRFYLAKIFLEEKNYEEVEQVLHPDHFRFEQGSPMRYEWAYLRAEAMYHRAQYEMAAAGFKESLMQQQTQNQNWQINALYNLGFCYLKLGEDNLLQSHSKEDFFHKAEEAFESLIQKGEKDKAHLALARTYLMQHYYLKDVQAVNKVHRLLKSYQFHDIESKLEAGFILADMTANLEQREKIYEALTSDYYSEAQNYGKAWYYRGIFHTQLSRLQKDLKRTDEAIEFYNKGYNYLVETHPNLALTSIKNVASGYLSYKSQEKLMEGYEFLDNFLSTKAEKFQITNLLSDIYCLKAELCLKLMSYDANAFLSKGLLTLDSMARLTTKEKKSARSLYLEARLYYQHGDYEESKKVFAKLVESYPSSSYVGESFFWMAECNDLEGGAKALSKDYRQKVFEEYPDNPLAAEAYFHYFSFPEYLEGRQEAIEHLQALESLFTDSPYVTASYYLQGIHKKQSQEEKDGQIIENHDYTAAITLFEESKKSFKSFWESNQISENNSLYFISIYYRSILAQAQCYLEKAGEATRAKRHLSFEKALAHFNEIYSDFQQSDHPLASVISMSEKYPKVFEEAEFGRAITYAKNGEIEAAEDAFGQMIEHFSDLKIEEGHYLSRAWYELAMIAMAKQEYTEAIEYLKCAESSMHKQMLNADHKIDLGIQQSLCYRYLNQFDMAMLTLSKVINEGVISNLRVKAMVLRAEIYELQGRRDLAQKQLEAAAKKGGEWSLVAQEKLVKEYGYN